MTFPAPFDADFHEVATGFEPGDDQMEESDSDDFLSIKSLPDRQTISLSVRAAYTNWNPREAFRELVQNWRDGIIASFALAEEEFVVECDRRIENGCTEIIYKVPRPDSTPKEWLGFIHYKSEGKGGTVEITNRNASLHPWHLDMGGTSKSGAGNLAGAHGEGLKVALLVLMRGNQNHKIRCRSSGFSWTFNFTKHGRLVARLNRMSTEAAGRLESQVRSKLGKTLLPFCPNAKNDVQFVLGEPHHGRSEFGVPTRRNPVRQVDFEAWTEAALFLQNPRPDELIRTASGDLLIGERFRQRLYLKGLLLSEDTPQRRASVTNKTLRYGYNFAAGTTNRERQSVAGAYEESSTIMDIWSRALVLRPELASELSLMLNSKQHYADVEGALKCVGRKTAQILRSYLIGHSDKRIWYYSPDEKRDCPRLNHVLYGLGYEGLELSQPYWNILRRHDLLRTADEEQCARFQLARPSSTLDDWFAARVSRLLHAAMRACGLVRGTNFCFVQAGTLDLHSLYVEDEELFIIHDRFMSKEGIAEALGLPHNLGTLDYLFHAVNKIFTDMLEQLPDDTFSMEDGAKPVEWQRRVHARLTEQRFFDYSRLETIRVLAQHPEPTITTEWLPDLWAPGTAIEIQYHSLSCAINLQKSVLVAADALSSKLHCLSAGSVLPAQSEQAESNMRSGNCRVLKTTMSERTRHAMTLGGKQEYMLLFLLPSEAGSFVSWRSAPPAEQPAQTPVNVVKGLSQNKSPGKLETACCDEPSSCSPHSPSFCPSSPGDDCFSPAWPSTADPLAVWDDEDEPKQGEPVLSSGKDCLGSQPAKYELGSPLETFDLLSISEWYEGKDVSAGSRKAVVGLVRPSANDHTLKRKRNYSASERPRASRLSTYIVLG